MKKIQKFSWADEDAKVKIYIDNSQFEGAITKEMISVTFEEHRCEINITDANGTVNTLGWSK
jgi:hypothetical protein